MTGQIPGLPIDKFVTHPEGEVKSKMEGIVYLALSRLQRQAEQRNNAKDKGKKFPSYQVGQQVLVKEHELSSGTDKEIHTFFLLYHGPYIIQEVKENNTLVVVDKQGKQYTHNLKNVKLYIPPDPGKCVKNREE